MSVPVRVLHVDLTKETSKLKVHSDLEDFLGGVGVSISLLSEYFEEFGYPERRNLDAPFALAAGPLCESYPGGHIVTASFVSLLTRNLGQSYTGGNLGKHLKRNGVDALFVSGRSKEPCYLVIQNASAQCKSAKNLWGKNTRETAQELEKDYPRAVKAVIGCAGEAGVRFSSVIVDNARGFQRGGLGAVWGKKNLKAIVVEEGEEPEGVNCESTVPVKEHIIEELADPRPDSVRFDLRSQHEKTWILEAEHNGLPSLNFSQTAEDYEDLRRSIFSGVAEEGTCQGCPVSCKDTNFFKGRPLQITFNNLASLGPQLGVKNKQEVLEILSFARDAALDPVSLGDALAFLTEKNGWEFGDLETYKALIRGLVERKEPWAKELSLGVIRAATPQSKDFAMTLSGLEMEPYFNGYISTLSQITAAEDSFDFNLAHLLDFKDLEGDQAVETLIAEEKKGLVLASLAVCPLLRSVYDTSQIFACLEGMGWGWKHEALEALGTRIYNLKWKVKKSLGFSWEDLHLPQRLFAVPTATGYMEENIIRKLIDMYRDQVDTL